MDRVSAGEEDCERHRSVFVLVRLVVGVEPGRVEGTLRGVEALAAGRDLPDQRRLGLAAFLDLEEHLLLGDRYRRNDLSTREREQRKDREARLALAGSTKEEGGGGHDG